MNPDGERGSQATEALRGPPKSVVRSASPK